MLVRADIGAPGTPRHRDGASLGWDNVSTPGSAAVEAPGRNADASNLPVFGRGDSEGAAKAP
jgi:hypothetical protein